MRIAVIDDEATEREIVHSFLKRFETEYHKKMDIEEFDNSDILLKSYHPVYDVLIFDIDMPGMNGMDCARKIREKDQDVVILFITNMAQYAINGYEVDAVDYIVKPVSYYDFSMKFQKAVRRVAQNQEKTILLEIGSAVHQVKVADIIYVEVLSHNVIYHLRDRTLKLRGSMKEQEAMLSSYNFSRIHKSYLVNLACIENIQKNTVTAAGEQLPIGKAYKSVVMQDFLRYMNS